jgi:hypothetical protein
MAYELTECDKRTILENSIERVINNSMRLVIKLSKRDEDASINYDDWGSLKELVCKLWDRERNAIFIEMQNREEKDA